MLALVAACGGTGGSAAASPSPSAATNDDLNTPAASLTGAGSTFDQPFFTRAFFEYNKANPKVTVNYASIGSGGGIAQIQAGTVNFGATDVPMAPADLAAAKNGVIEQVPVTLGGVTVSYNLTGVQSGLHLTGDVLANIFLGKITKWNDPALKSLNPKIDLPDQAITVVHRSDSSGTSYIFTDYLSNVSPAWKAGPGTGKSVNWPVGVGGKGNEGVAGSVKQVAGSIGYVELAYALQNQFTVAAMQNQAGKFVQPSLTTVAADAAQKPNVTPTDFSIVNAGGAQSYPISGYSWVVLYQQQSDHDAGLALVKMLDWLTQDQGQQQAKAVQYVPLPANIQHLARVTLLNVKDSTGKAFLNG
ncbi:MAG: phosphate ABC transporter substrate-binding protein PstS [Actinobacteria bacterium]|nr:phosphate ABC transporter substrate-binding protein PstS [Actinomycetota bacterium]